MAIGPLILLVSACAVSSALTMLARKTAPRFGLTDKPDSHRKTHAGPMPLGGGVAVLLAAASVLGALFILPSPFRSPLRENWWEPVGLLVAGTATVIVGLLDDRLGLRGRQKLLGQILAVSAVIAGGLVIRQITILGWQFALGPLGLPFTLFWLLGATNALNLLDGMDGSAATVGIILTSAIGAMAMVTGKPEVTIISLVFAGSLLGFMVFNLPPAKVFLGDAGSMLIGLVVGVLAIQGSLRGPETLLLAAPLALWTIPILDSTAAILRRRLTGRSIYTTDCSHLHHRLLDRAGSNAKALVWLAGACALTSGAAVAGVFLASDLLALLGSAAVVALFIVGDIFGRGEFLLLANRLRHIARSLLPGASPGASNSWEVSVCLQGSRRWDLLWKALTTTAERSGLSSVELDLNIPAAHEAFSARWKQDTRSNGEQCWRVTLPILAANRQVGRLEVSGRRQGVSICEDLARLAELLEPVVERLMVLSHEPDVATTWEVPGETTYRHDPPHRLRPDAPHLHQKRRSRT